MYSVEDIRNEFHNKRINKEEAIKRLISMIESLGAVEPGWKQNDIENYWDAIDAEVDAIDMLRKLNLKRDEAFSVLESIIVSEREFLIKVKALKAVAELFPEKCDRLLKWLSENDFTFKSIANDSWGSDYYQEKILRSHNFAILYDNIIRSNNEKLKALRERIEKKMSAKIRQHVWEGVNAVEAKILTIFELQFEKLSKINREIDFNRFEDENCYRINGEGHVTEIYMRPKECEVVIPQRIDLLPFLERLILISAEIRVIPDSVRKLKNLKVLNLGFNRISNLTSPKYLPESLEELNLRDNRIKLIPESILRLKNLEILEISSNQIEIIPNSFKNLTNLKEICLVDNKISHIPESLKELKSAIIINLEANPVRELPNYFNSAEWRSKIKVSPSPIDPLAVLPEFASKLGLDAETEALSRKILELNKWRFQLNDTSPKTILAAVLYYVCKTKNCKINGIEITQKYVSRLIGAEEYCINAEYNRLLEKFKRNKLIIKI